MGLSRRVQTEFAPLSLGAGSMPSTAVGSAARASLSARSGHKQDAHTVATALGEGALRARSPQMQAKVEHFDIDPKLVEDSRFITDSPGNNVPPHIITYVGRDLHLNPNHPLGIIKKKIAEYFDSLDDKFEMIDNKDPLVSAQNCFDDLLIPLDHPGRQATDTYYVTRDGGKKVSSSADTLLRTHTSAHQSELLREGKERFLCTGDVYRRDEIDKSHFPVFHQMEGVKLFPVEEVGGEMTREEWLASPGCKAIADDLKKTLEGLCDHLFGPVEKRWIDEYFPFTEPSFELEIFYNGDWMEVLGSGVVHSGVLENVGLSNRHGWAFGLGLERLAMVLFEIQDIRLFWSEDERFTKQFKAGEIVKFQPFSKYPPCMKDISFFIPPAFEANDFFELARGISGDRVEEITNIDVFTNPKTNKTSHAYRIVYRSMERTLENEEVNKLLFDLVSQSEEKLGVEVRK
jgi:phenylalanyl-tRNA synthetase alpha chain